MSFLTRNVSNDTIYGDTRTEEGAPRRICVGNIPTNTSVRDILKFFGHDRVEAVTINNKNPHFVFAFVQFKRPDGKTEALLMNETEFMGKRISIRNYTDKPNPADHNRAREKYRQDFEAREAKPKFEPIGRSIVQHPTRSPHSSSRNRNSSKGHSGSSSRRRDISPARSRHGSRSRSRPDSFIRRRQDSPIRSRLTNSPRDSHISARDQDWDFIRRGIERSDPSARHSNSRNHDRNCSPTQSRRRSRSRSPAPSLSIASEIYRQAARKTTKSPPSRPANPFSLGYSPGFSNGSGFLKQPSSALQTYNPQTEQLSSGLAPATFQVPAISTASVTANGFTAAPTNGFTSTPANLISVNDQGTQATNENHPTMNSSIVKDMPADVKLPLEMALMEGTALNLSVFQINKVIQYFETSRLKLERPSLANAPLEPYVTEPPSVTSGNPAVDEDELALRVADKFSSISRKIHR